jgi:hypothetical protein
MKHKINSETERKLGFNALKRIVTKKNCKIVTDLSLSLGVSPSRITMTHGGFLHVTLMLLYFTIIIAVVDDYPETGDDIIGLIPPYPPIKKSL